MKKAILLTVLLVVAASAAITFTFPDGPPTTVGVPVKVTITSEVAENVDLFVDSNVNYTWVYPTVMHLGADFTVDTTIEITHPFTDNVLYASKGAENGSSESFSVVIGAAAKWQIIAPGESKDEGNAANPSGKTGTGSVTAGDTNTYDVNVCDKWYNTIEDNPMGYTIDTDDEFEYVSGNDVELRIASRTAEVTISGGSYTDDVSDVDVNFGTASQLLMLCPGDTIQPGDNSVSAFPGKYGAPVTASVLTDYEITIWAVDRCWNPVTNYSGSDDVVVSTATEPITTVSESISGGRADVTVQFQDVNTTGEWIGATADALQTSYDTKVIVQAGVTDVNALLSKLVVPPDVNSTLSAAPTIAGDPVGAGYPCYIDLLEDLTTGDPTTFQSDEVMYTDQDGIAESLVSATAEGEYYIEVTVGTAMDTVVLTVQELTELLIYPNPYKYSVHGDIPVSFDYKVEQVGQGGASEIVLLIADIYGNLVYKATYDINDEVTNPGQQTITWDCKNNNMHLIASGMYQAVLKITLINGTTSALKKNFMVIW